ncbi:MAG: hypothetical protein CTR55_25575 [Pseudomonas sp.]|nr:MAG: hypothetical protein CTR55_25575 [Pseudomonas sp.]
MTTDNPFTTPHAELIEAASRTPPSFGQPYYFMAAMLFSGIATLSISFLLNLSAGTIRRGFLSSMPATLGYWLSSVLIACAVVMLFMNIQRERHAIVRFRPIVALVVAFMVLRILSVRLLSGLGEAGIANFNAWMYKMGNPMGVIISVLFLGALLHILLSLPAIWLTLRVARGRFERSTSAGTAAVPRFHVAMAVALCFAGTCSLLAAPLAPGLMPGESARWAPSVTVLVCLLLMSTVLQRTWQVLPPTLPHFPAGRIIWAALGIFLLSVPAAFLSGYVGYLALSDSLVQLRASTGNALTYLLPTLWSLLVVWSVTGLVCRRLLNQPLAQSSPR